MAGVELFRPQPRLEIPENQPKVPQLDFTPLNQIGNTIVEGQRRQAITAAVGQATGPDGKINFERAAANLSKIPGALDEARPFLSLALQREAAGRAAAAQTEQARHHRAIEGTAAAALEGKLDEPIILKRVNPDTEETEEYVTTRRQLRQGVGQGTAPVAQPIQRAPLPAPAAVPGPQSSIGAPPAVASADDEGALPSGATLAQGQAAPVIPMQGTERPPPIPGASPKTLRTERAKAIVANEEDAVKSARAAAELKPHVDKMVEAWAKLQELEGIGPIVGSGPDYGPRKAAALFHTKAEALRQQYDTAQKAVQARITAAQNKGEGAVSNFERQLYAAQFPQLTASDPTSQFPFLQQLQATTNATIQGGRETKPLSNSPGVILDRPAVGSAPAQSGAAPPAAAARPSAGNGKQFKSPNDVDIAIRKGILKSGDTFLDSNGVPRMVP